MLRDSPERPALIASLDELSMTRRGPKKIDQRTVQVAFRLPKELVARVDAYAELLNAEHPGLDATRADAFRVLLTTELDKVTKASSKQEEP